MLVDRLAYRVRDLNLIFLHAGPRDVVADLLAMLFVNRLAHRVRHRDLILLHDRPADRVRHVLVARFIDGPADRVRHGDLVFLHAIAVSHIAVFAAMLFVDGLAHRIRLLHVVPFGARLADSVTMLAIVRLVHRPTAGVALLLHHRVINGTITDLRMRFGDRLIPDAIGDRWHAARVGAAHGRR